MFSSQTFLPKINLKKKNFKGKKGLLIFPLTKFSKFLIYISHNILVFLNFRFEQVDVSFPKVKNETISSLDLSHNSPSPFWKKGLFLFDSHLTQGPQQLAASSWSMVHPSCLWLYPILTDPFISSCFQLHTPFSACLPFPEPYLNSLEAWPLPNRWYKPRIMLVCLYSDF